jgi:hypothetical protein
MLKNCERRRGDTRAAVSVSGEEGGMALVREPDPETRERARRLYEGELVSQADIALMLGLTDSTLRRRIQQWGWARRTHDIADGLPSAPPPTAFQPCDGEATYDRRSTIERVRCAVDREIAAVEAALSRLGSLTRRVPESERAARTLASLVKTLTELKRLETASDEGEADDGPADIDEFRRDLARRLHGLCESRAD